MITYRKATANDVRPALDLALEVFLEFEAAEYEPEATPRFKTDVVYNETAIQNWINGVNSMYVACDGDKIVGVVGEKWGIRWIIAFFQCVVGFDGVRCCRSIRKAIIIFLSIVITSCHGKRKSIKNRHRYHG